MQHVGCGSTDAAPDVLTDVQIKFLQRALGPAGRTAVNTPCNHSNSICSSNESPSAASRGRQNSYTDFWTGRSTPESGGSAVSSTRCTPSAAVSPTVRDMDVGPPGDPYATREDEMICVGRCGEFGRCGNSTRTVCSRRQASLSCGNSMHTETGNQHALRGGRHPSPVETACTQGGNQHALRGGKHPSPVDHSSMHSGRQSACTQRRQSACTLLWTITELAAEQRAEGVGDAGMLPDGLPFSRPNTKGTQC